MSSPTFVFSLGAWVPPAVFDETRSHLESLGFPSECPAHPSIGAQPPSKTLEDDVASLQAVLTTLTDEGRDLVVVSHSYGGVVASCAVEGLSKAARSESGKPGGVVKVVYLAAFALDKGQSLLDMLGGNYLPWMKIEVSLSPSFRVENGPCLINCPNRPDLSREQGDYVLADGAGEVGWQDLSVEQQEKWNARAQHTSRAVFSGKSTYEPWRDIPCAYIVCEQDRALPPPFQELFSSKVAGAENTYRLPSSHSPFLSMPDRLTEVLQEIVKVK